MVENDVVLPFFGRRIPLSDNIMIRQDPPQEIGLEIVGLLEQVEV